VFFVCCWYLERCGFCRGDVERGDLWGLVILLFCGELASFSSSLFLVLVEFSFSFSSFVLCCWVCCSGEFYANVYDPRYYKLVPFALLIYFLELSTSQQHP